MNTTSSSTPTPGAESDLGSPKEFRIPRAHDRDLAFSGWEIGFAESERETLPNWREGIQVRIYLTEGQRFVTHSLRWKERDDEIRSEQHEVDHHWDSTDALEWLKADSGKKLGQTSKKAWLVACGTWPGLAGEDVERIG